jgi:hypothetical protein
MGGVWHVPYAAFLCAGHWGDLWRWEYSADGQPGRIQAGFSEERGRVKRGLDEQRGFRLAVPPSASRRDFVIWIVYRWLRCASPVAPHLGCCFGHLR